MGSRISDARGKFIIMGDADDSYDFSAIEPFIAKLREGYDLVMGNRLKGGIKLRAYASIDILAILSLAL